MTKKIESSFKGKEGDHSRDMEVHLEFVDRSKVSKSDHVIEIVDGLAKVTKGPDGNSSANLIGRAESPKKSGLPNGGKHIKIDNRLFTGVRDLVIHTKLIERLHT